MAAPSRHDLRDRHDHLGRHDLHDHHDHLGRHDAWNTIGRPLRRAAAAERGWAYDIGRLVMTHDMKNHSKKEYGIRCT